jgi:hypothetical protein
VRGVMEDAVDHRAVSTCGFVHDRSARVAVAGEPGEIAIACLAVSRAGSRPQRTCPVCLATMGSAQIFPSWAQQRLDGAALVHGAVALGHLRQRQV